MGLGNHPWHLIPFMEGQRRYVESLSACSPIFTLMQKPDVDSIDGLSPAISIEQKTTSKNPRSITVRTVTELYDYLRLTLRADRCAALSGYRVFN